MFDKYLRHGSPACLNLSDHATKKVQQLIEDSRKGKLEPTVFDELRKEALKIMEIKQFPKFMKHMMYLTMCDCMAYQKPFELPPQVPSSLKISQKSSDLAEVQTHCIG